jgi:hypothetical protein
MSIVRQQLKVVEAVATQRVYACSTGDVISTSDINGSVIDRLALGRLYHVAVPFAIGRAVAGTTQANEKITVAVRLQHGDSSGGGDMADYSTQNQPDDAVFNTSAMTTPMDAWSTGAARVESREGAYSIVGAKQFIRPVITVTLPGNTTATASGDNVDVSGGVVFVDTDEAPGRPNQSGAFSTSTSTST